MHDPLNGELGRLVALAPPRYGRINALVRQTCAKTLSLPPLPAEVTVDGPADEAESVVVEFAEQFSVDVSSIDDDLRARFTSALGKSAFPAVVLTYFADYLPRVRAGLDALGVPCRGPTRSCGITTAILETCSSTGFSRAWPDCANSIR